MVSLRFLLAGHERAVEGLRDAEWLLDADVANADFERRMQWIYVQMVLTVSLYERLSHMGFISEGLAGGSYRLVDLIDVCEREQFLGKSQVRWLRFFNKQANDAKHDLSRL